MTQPYFRRAKLSDSQELKSLDTVVPYDATREDLIEQWLRDDYVVVAEIDDRIVGYGVFNHAFFHQGQAEMVMVHEEYRGKRIGENILKELESICDTPKFYVTTNQTNHQMQRLFIKLGYRPGGYIHELDPEDPELVFVKDIQRT